MATPSCARVRAVASALLLAGLTAAGAARDAGAQMVPYMGVGVERAPVEGPPVNGLDGTGALRLLLFVGLSHEAPDVVHGPEIQLGRLAEHRRQAGWTPQQGEAPLGLGLTAWTVTGFYRLAVPVRRWPVRPYVRLGGSWGHLTDELSSDTPTEQATSHAWGAHAGGGVGAPLGRGLHLWISGDYSVYTGSSDRPALSLSLGGWAFSGRIGVTL